VTVFALAGETRWVCPNCPTTAVTHQAAPHTEFHQCPGLAGLNAPMVREGVRCKVEAVERGDWVGAEMVQTDGNGRPVMSVVTTRDDGTDVAVYAPTAFLNLRS
jgi:hypothetical protein